jgi:O-acetyl-ADP-ribose deacetylase (regulator of RNase III)
MGKGVVVPIVKKYIGVKQACQGFVKDSTENGAVGRAFRYACEAGAVYNLFSKEIFRHKAGYGVTVEQYHSNLKNCLEDMKSQMLSNDEKFIAMPKIACGLDRCDWKDVEKIIKDVFGDTDIEILVCVI